MANHSQKSPLRKRHGNPDRICVRISILIDESITASRQRVRSALPSSGRLNAALAYVRSLSPAAPPGLADRGRRHREFARQRDRDPVPRHLPARRPALRSRNLRSGGRVPARDRNRRQPARRPRGRLDRRADDPDGLPRPARGRLRRLPVRATPVAGIRARPDRRRRQRRLRAEPLEPARRAHLARAAHGRLRPYARDRQSRLRHRRPHRRVDRDDERPRQLRRPLRGGRGHVPGVHRPALLRARTFVP